jgi:hypothetical protein
LNAGSGELNFHHLFGANLRLSAADAREGRTMKKPFNVVHSPDYQEVFNPKPVGTQVDPCVRRDPPPSYPDFVRISEVVRSPNFDDLFGQKTKGPPANPHVER